MPIEQRNQGLQGKKKRENHTLTVISGPRIDAFPYESAAIEYREIPSANF